VELHAGRLRYVAACVNAHGPHDLILIFSAAPITPVDRASRVRRPPQPPLQAPQLDLSHKVAASGQRRRESQPNPRKSQPHPSSPASAPASENATNASTSASATTITP
jgi:hypothetical protein